MKVETVLADSAADAVAQIRHRLGPEAVVVNVRQKTADGLAGLWQKPRIEVLAYRPEAASQLPVPEVLAALRDELTAIRRRVDGHDPLPSAPALALATAPSATRSTLASTSSSGFATAPAWSVKTLLESSGLLPLHAESLIERLQGLHGPTPPANLSEELDLARALLQRLWRPAASGARRPTDRPHVFIGPAGVGKTTCLCKWLAQSVLLEERHPRVWRLDGITANTAESLSVYGEILGVPVERSWNATNAAARHELAFIDLPGVNWTDPLAMKELGQKLAPFADAEIHLVLNAAYETSVLLAQVRAFAGLPVTDLIVTHLDEEPRWGKLWNLVLGTNYPLRFLGAGQNVPGDFQPATAERILARQFPNK